MSLYNMLHGINPVAPLLLSMLDIEPNDIERLRDVYIGQAEENGPLCIAVFTRTGGGNREAYPNEKLVKHPWYVRDFDDSFDCTYATYLFQVDGPMQEILQTLVDEGADTTEPMQKMKNLIEKLQSRDVNDPEVTRAIELGKEISSKLNNSKNDEIIEV